MPNHRVKILADVIGDVATVPQARIARVLTSHTLLTSPQEIIWTAVLDWSPDFERLENCKGLQEKVQL